MKNRSLERSTNLDPQDKAALKALANAIGVLLAELRQEDLRPRTRMAANVCAAALRGLER